MMTVIKLIVKKFLWFLCKIVYRVQLKGQENLPKAGAVLVCANHLNNLDGPIIVFGTRRLVHFMCKKEIFDEHKIVGKLISGYGVFPIKRGGRDAQALKNAMNLLEEGEIVGMFPEGTRNGMAKGIKPKNGAAYIALTTKVNVVPLAIKGTYKIFSKVKYQYGTPIDLSQYYSENPDKETLDKVSQIIMDGIKKELTNI